MRKDENQFHDDADRRLWQRLRQATGSPGTPNPADLDPNDLAAYLDGTADGALVDSIEQRMAVDPGLLEAVIELRQIRDAVGQDNNSAVPQSVTSAAKDLVDHESASRDDQAPAILYRISWSRLQWAAAAVFVLTAGWGGYRTGLSAYTTDALSNADAPALMFGLEDLDEPAMALVDGAAGGEL